MQSGDGKPLLGASACIVTVFARVFPDDFGPLSTDLCHFARSC